jgi:biotin carboxylase
LSEKPGILIFGAGINQLELIREARSLCLTRIVIDPQPDPPGRSEADFFYQVGGSDYELTRSIAIKHKVRGIVTGQMEKPLRLMARLAQELDLVFNSPEVTERCLDKWLMKKAFTESKILCARGILLKAGEKLPERLTDDFCFPVIIKPRDAFSSRGVYKCDTYDELKSRLADTRGYSYSGDIIMEEFLAGKEYSVEAVTCHGQTTIVQFTEKFITAYPNTVELAHLQPADLTPHEREVASSVVIRTLKALGVEDSASHTEIMMTEKGPVVIEVGARLGGDFIASYLTKSSCGVSMDRAAVQIAMGIEPDIIPGTEKYSMVKYIELPAGRKVIEVLPAEDIKQLPGVVFAHIFVNKGDTIEQLVHSAMRPACIIVTADTKEVLFERINVYAGELAKKILLT